MSVALTELKSLLAKRGVTWHEVGSAIAWEVHGYFQREMPDGTVLRAMVILYDKDMPVHTEMERQIYRRLGLDDAPFN